MDLQILYNNPRRKKHSVRKNPGLNRRRSLRGMFRRNPSQDELPPALPASLRSKPKVSSTFKKTMDDYLKTRKVKESEVKEEKTKKASKKKASKKASKKKASKKKAAKKVVKKAMKKVVKKTKKKVAKKVVKKAKKRVAKKAMKKSYKKKAAKKVAKKVAKKARRKNKKKVVKKSNPVTKIRTKKARKKSARKAARTRAKNKAKKVLARKKAAKKAVRTRKRLKKAGYKKVDKKKLKALKKKLKDKRFKTKGNPYKKTKHKRKSNPFGGAMKKFKEVTKHEIKEAGGLFAGGALIKVYDYHLKQRFLAPMLQPIMSKLGAAAPAADAIIDVLASVLIGQGLSFVGKKAKIDALDLVGKGLIGASVVQLGIKTVSSASAAVGMPMNGIIGVPSMSGIIGVPSMNGIIGVPSMGAYSADFQGLGAQGMSNSDFGAYKTVGLEGSYLQAADYDSGSVIPTAPRTPEAFAGYDNVEYSDEGEDGDF